MSDTAVPFSLLRTLRACLDGTVDQVELERARDDLDSLLLAEPAPVSWEDELPPETSPVEAAAYAARVAEYRRSVDEAKSCHEGEPTIAERVLEDRRNRGIVG